MKAKVKYTKYTDSKNRAYIEARVEIVDKDTDLWSMHVLDREGDVDFHSPRGRDYYVRKDFPGCKADHEAVMWTAKVCSNLQRAYLAWKQEYETLRVPVGYVQDLETGTITQLS